MIFSYRGFFHIYIYALFETLFESLFYETRNEWDIEK